MSEVDLIEAVAKAIDDTARRMDATRYAVPAQRRERYFGGYKERLLAAQACAAIAVCRATMKGGGDG